MPILYKYLPYKAAFSVMETGMLWLTRPESFNDAFELRPYFESIKTPEEIAEDRAREAAFSKANPRMKAVIEGTTFIANLDSTKSNFVRNHTKSLVVLSLSESRENLLLWAHYADAHTGIVLGFDAEGDILLDYSPHRTALQAVTYSKDRPARKTWGEVTNADLWLTKSEDWSYEKEWRIVDSLYSADGEPVRRPFTSPHSEPVHYPFRFKPAALKEVIFGCRSKRGEGLNEAADLLKSRYPGASLLSAQRDPTRYAIKFHSRDSLLSDPVEKSP